MNSAEREQVQGRNALNVAKWQSGKVANVSHFGEAMVADLRGEKRNPQPLVWRLRTRRDFNKMLCSDCEWAVAHATRGAEGSQSCRED